LIGIVHGAVRDCSTYQVGIVFHDRALIKPPKATSPEGRSNRKKQRRSA